MLFRSLSGNKYCYLFLLDGSGTRIGGIGSYEYGGTAIYVPTSTPILTVWDNSNNLCEIQASSIKIGSGTTLSNDGSSALVQVNGDIHAYGDITTDNNIGLNGSLNVNGNVSINSDISTNGNIYLNGSVAGTGDITTNGNISTSGTVSAGNIIATRVITGSIVNAISSSFNNKGYKLPSIQFGSASLSTAVTKIFTFAKAMPSVNYSVALSSNTIISNLIWSGKTVGGFTSSMTSFSGILDYIVIG